MASPLEIMISSADLLCTVCGKPQSAKCDCWTKCSCGWFARKGQQCRNPATTRCTTKVQFGKYNRRTKRYDPR